jgi:tetratricopeptide (TPR) repeat protein
VDAATAGALLTAAVEIRTAMRDRRDGAAVTHFEREHAAMREAMDWYLDQGRTEDADRFASAMVPLWIATKRIADGEAWFERALGDGATDDPRRARALYDHGYLVFWAGQYELAEQRFGAARRLAGDGGDADVVALALAGSARIALNLDPHAAVELLREAMEVTRDLPDSPGRSSADHVLGVALQMAGDLEGAREVMTARLSRARAAGNEAVVFVESMNLSMVERQLGNLDRAHALSLEALAIVAGKRDEMAIPWVINGLAAVTSARGASQRGATLVGIAEGLLERAGGEWPPDERRQFEETLATLSSRLSPEALAEARRAGRALELDEALAYASGSDPSVNAPAEAAPEGL